MKKIIYLLILLIMGISNAQIISFADDDLRLKLVESDVTNNIAKSLDGNNLKIDADNNGQITVQEAALVYELYLPNQLFITSIEGIEFFANLTKLDVQNCSITGNVNLSNMLFLEYIYLNINKINSINLSSCIAMKEIDCNNNLIQKIDVSTLINLQSLKLANNPILQIFAKNGANEAIDFSGVLNQSINYICADEIQVSNIQGQVTNSCIVNSLCTDTPGGNFNTITGTLYFDTEGNGRDVSDLPHPYAKLKSNLGNDDSTILQTVTKSDATYKFTTTEIGGFDLIPSIENPSWFNISPVAGNFIDTNNNVFNQDYLLAPIGIHFDVEVMIRPISQVMPGADVTYEIVFKNKGNQPHSGQVAFDYNEVVFSFVSSSLPVVNLGTGILTLAYSNLLPFETRSFRVTLNLSNSVNTGDVLPFSISIDANGEDLATQNDNVFNYFQKVVAKNPNRIECIQGDLLSNTEIGNYLHYAVNFENTGSQTAQNVVINTSFNPTKYDVNSIQVLNATSELVVNVTNENATMSLRKANVRGPGGQGGILLKVRSKSDLTSGSTVNTSAQVFFEYETIQTAPSVSELELAKTTYQSLSTTENTFDETIIVYPNPAVSVVLIESKNNIQTVQLYDIYGRLLQTNLQDSTTSRIDFTQRCAGIYFVKITSDKGQKVEKIVKK